MKMRLEDNLSLKFLVNYVKLNVKLNLRFNDGKSL